MDNKDLVKVNMVDLDFDNIKSNIINYMKSKPEFTDYDFQGSAINSLIDLLAYNSQYSAVLANFMTNEMFLDSAILRSSVVSKAKELGYVPESVKAARATIDIEIQNVDPSLSSLFLPAGTVFQGKTYDGTSFDFITIDDYNLLPKEIGSRTFVVKNVTIYQGTRRLWTFTVSDPASDRYVLPNSAIDTNTLKVSVRESKNSSRSEPYILASSVMEFSNIANVFFLKEVDSSYYQLYFQDPKLGKVPQTGNIIACTFVETQGIYGNGCDGFSVFGNIGGYSSEKVIITTLQPSFGGSDRESIESVRNNAYLSFAASNRSVTPDDYKYHLKREFPQISDIQAWGGEDNVPPMFGFIMLSAFSRNETGNYRNLSNEEVYLMESSAAIRKGVVAVRPRFIHPEFTWIELVVDVLLNTNRSIKKVNEIQSQIIDFIHDLNTQVSTFDQDLYYSKLLSGINALDPAIISNSVNLELRKSFYFLESARDKTIGFAIDFNAAIEPLSIRSSQAKIIGETVEFSIYDDGQGNIKLQTIDASTGLTVKTSTVVGSVNYSKGIISLNSINFDLSDPVQFDVFAEPTILDLMSRQNHIFTIDLERLKVQVISKAGE